MSLAERYNALLPQTQCTECGYPGCKPYAEALSSGVETNPSLCLPGGDTVAQQLAEATGFALQPSAREPLEVTAYVDVDHCIGCNLCMKICPVDAFVGALNYEHQVIESDCTGCQLCVPVCPTQCIALQPRFEPLPSVQKNLNNMQRKAHTQECVKAHKMQNHRGSLANLRAQQDSKS